uniref:Uncharacterized protein n=1 Tax=Cacopsylla melanoneura TaxID=428564 RepID=A0A8D8VCP2_9HEMI
MSEDEMKLKLLQGIFAGIPAVGSNYSTIWQALKERYEDKRSLANSYVEKILDFKTLKCESIEGYKHFIDQVSECSSKSKCKKCSRKHNTLLHLPHYESDMPSKSSDSSQPSPSTVPVSALCASSAKKSPSTVLLSTVKPTSKRCSYRSMFTRKITSIKGSCGASLQNKSCTATRCSVWCLEANQAPIWHKECWLNYLWTTKQSIQKHLKKLDISTWMTFCLAS